MFHVTKILTSILLLSHKIAANLQLIQKIKVDYTKQEGLFTGGNIAIV